MITGPTQTVKRARKLRSEMSLPETTMWKELRKRPGGFKFRRQHPAGVYVLDFYCASLKLAIEIDGFAHDSGNAARKDAAKSYFLRSQSIATTRIPAKAVLQEKDAVVVRLVEICEERKAALGLDDGSNKINVPLHHAAHGPPPHAGED